MMCRGVRCSTSTWPMPFFHSHPKGASNVDAGGVIVPNYDKTSEE